MATASYGTPNYQNSYVEGLVSEFTWTPGDVVRFYLRPGAGQTAVGSAYPVNWQADGAGEALVAAAAAWNGIANIRFERAMTAVRVDIDQTLYSDGSDDQLGSHYLPNNQGLGGRYNTVSELFTSAGNARGGLSFVTFLHELGHALGLDHPFEDDPFPGVTDAYEIGDHGLNQGMWTVMSYNDGLDSIGDPTDIGHGYAATPMAFDIAALQAMYGADYTTRTGNDVYFLPGRSGAGSYFACIWDAAGIDTISGINTPNCVIDLRAATLLNAVGGGGWLSRGRSVMGGFTIANGVVIENAIGSEGYDQIIGNAANNVLTGLAGNDTLNGTGGDDTLYGGDGNDDLMGGAGNDYIRGGSGLDLLKGSTGDDIYYVEDLRAQIYEDVRNGGYDGVYVAVSGYSVRDNVEAIAVVGDAAIDVTGNDSDNRIRGNAAVNRLAGQGGQDTIFGGDGDDWLEGGNGNDWLDGGTGLDILDGGLGVDIYIIDSVGDRIVETGNQIDGVFSSVDYTLSDRVENMTLTGTATVAQGNASANVLKGNAVGNTIWGLAGNDVIASYDGSDAIVGGAGQDLVAGGAGADRFVFDDNDFNTRSISVADVVMDFSRAQGDKIDLRPVDAVIGGQDNAFRFIGTAAFTGAAGQLRYQHIGVNSYVIGDTNGDRAIDVLIRVNGLIAFVASDFGL